MNKIDITMTATIRPDIVNKTLESFCKNMFSDRDRYNLILNVDPIGEETLRKNVYKVARKYFNSIILNYPSTPGFTKAVIWCWSQTSSNYVFHLEDDWELLIPIDIDAMIKILDSNPTLVSLRLNKQKTGKNILYKKNGFLPYPKISLNPTLFNGRFIQRIHPLMDVNLNPEKQLRVNNTPRGKYLSKFTHGIYTRESVRQIVKDIGREWMNKSRYTKKIGFMNWENKN